MPARQLRSLALLWLCLLSLIAPTREAGAQDLPPQLAAIEAFREGRYEDTISALTAFSEPELRYLTARALAELGRYDEALAKLPEPVATWPDQVRADIVQQRLGWLAEAARCPEVAALAVGTTDPQLIRFLARCAFNARDFTRVRELLAAAKDDDGRGMYVRALYALGERALALPLLRALYVQKPVHPDAVELSRLLREAEPSLTLTSVESLDRAEALIAARHLDEALAELDALTTLPDRALEGRRQHLRGEALFRTRRRYPDAALAFANAVSLGSETEAYDAFHAIRATSRAGQDKDAIKRYRGFAKSYPTSSYAPDAVYLAAWLSARQGAKGAREELSRFANSDLAKRQKGLLRDAEWDLGWLAYLQRDHAAASSWLGRYQRDASSELELARASYWLGRSELAAGKKARAKEHFLAAIDAERQGYYAQLSVSQLKLLGASVPSAFDEAAPVEPARAADENPASSFYAALGLHADAARVAEAGLAPDSPRAVRIATMSAAGDAAKAFSASSPLLNVALRAGPVAAGWLWQALFPRPYSAVVSRESERNALPVELFYGHMQVESRYRAEVVSGADAIGLMQLLPSTGAAVAKRLGLPATRRALKQPYINIALGAAFLGQLLKTYDGQYPLAIAAYNAGADRVNEWARRTGRVELARWVEEIPVEQTRNYVRRVIAAWARYSLSTSPREPWRLPLPTHVGLRKK